ncbi:MAG: hypothetical protein EZS28_013850 [Streblomastix strix]|uniref:B30.2/SPRY domain-containing protein n=1 Tax=Streblomastix strix TaxID=222440 RepID=A0A5J4W7J6_9EUKA|nr:MAG: hypothetical protein EZS28_013850 [Streblomastix strix]
MAELNDYNVSGSLLGLGQFILIEILCEMIFLQDVRQFLVKESQGKQLENKFIHSYEYNDWCTIAIDPAINDWCTIAIDPAIKVGIVRFEVVFENSGWNSLGIADASCSFAAGIHPSNDGKKTVRYLSYSGDLDHIIKGTKGNRSYEDGQRISAIVDMTSNPRKVVFYVDDIEQPNFVIGIPSEIRFWVLVGSKALQWGKSWK